MSKALLYFLLILFSPICLAQQAPDVLRSQGNAVSAIDLTAQVPGGTTQESDSDKLAKLLKAQTDAMLSLDRRIKDLENRIEKLENSSGER